MRNGKRERASFELLNQKGQELEAAAGMLKDSIRVRTFHDRID